MTPFLHHPFALCPGHHTLSEALPASASLLPLLVDEMKPDGHWPKDGVSGVCGRVPSTVVTCTLPM